MKLSNWLSQKTTLSSNELNYLTKAVLQHSLHIDCVIPELALRCLEIALKKRESGIPLAKIINKKPFYNDEFYTNEYTLDPRSETESLLEEITFKPRSILELGVGTGCLIISALKLFPKAKGLGVDICEEALKVAKLNSFIHGMEKKLTLKQNNWAEKINGRYDLILCNPPYVKKDAVLSLETQQDPALALFGNIETYENIVKSLKEVTWHQIIFEVPDFLVEQVLNLFGKEFEKKNKEIYTSQVHIVKIINEKYFK